MKSLKRLFLGVLLAVAAVFLVACNSKKIMEPMFLNPQKRK
ncbi:putative lipoprotein [Streptococcus infantis SK970]|nr:putative lipoprotein [Streptococcus infantis SK970]